MNRAIEIRYKLQNWDKGQPDSERLSGLILEHLGYVDLNPIHPLGGPDGGKDIICKRENGTNWIGAVYFASSGEQSFKKVKAKFKNDLGGAVKNGADGIVFVCNQKISDTERVELSNIAKEKGIDSDIIHLDKLVHILNTPIMYGVRYDFLGIEISKEEELSYLETVSRKQFININQKIDKLYELMMSESVHAESWDFLKRKEEEVIEAEQEFFEKIWHERHLLLKYRVENGLVECDETIFNTAKKKAKELENKYGEGNLGPYSDFEWGMINGKLSALRWVLGDEWDMLDT